MKVWLIRKIQLLENKANSPKGYLLFALLFYSNKGLYALWSMGLCGNFALDVHYDKLAYFVNSGFPWRDVTQLWEVFQNLLNEVQGELMLSIRRSMSVFAAGNMCYLIMDSSLVKEVNTITLATYQTFFFWSWLTLYTIIAHCLNSFTV